MFDISWGEFLIVGVVALIVIGPKELPGVIRSVGRGMAKLRAMASDFRGQFDDAMREAELHEVQKEFNEFKNQATGLSTATFDPIRKEVQSALETAKAAASGEPTPTTSEPVVSETVSTIQADAQAMEAEIRSGITDAVSPVAVANPGEIAIPAPEPEPAPAKKRRKAPAGDAA